MSGRRKFLQQLGATAIMASASSLRGIAADDYTEHRLLLAENKISSTDRIRVACIGMGIMGMRNVKTILQIPGVEFVAACDLYKGRLERSKELFGHTIFITQDYHEILLRKDIDAVIVATSDQWHDQISMDAMKAGKAVYCEKPVVHQLNQGRAVIETQRKTGVVLQVGSQRVSSIAYAKAKELYQAGEIGELNCIEASFDRHTAMGAWQYTIPTDANEDRIAWKKYLRGNTNTVFDENRFFRWRNYKEYGTGVAGDLFVHLLSGIHFLTNAKGPSRIFATGALSYWKDGRNVPDVMTSVMEYAATNEHPAFQVLLKVNLASGAEKTEAGKVKFYGTEGVIDFGWNDFVIRRNKFAKAPGYGGWDTFDTYTEAEQKKIINRYNQRYSTDDKKLQQLPDLSFSAPDGYDDRLDHFINFFNSVRNSLPVVEDASFGFRAAAPCLACNESYFKNREIRWDADKMKLV